MTIIEDLLEHEEILEAMMKMPSSYNKSMVRSRRRQLFSFMWTHGDINRREALNIVNRAELTFVREYDNYNVPRWLIRLEAQDILLKEIYNRLVEKGAISEEKQMSDTQTSLEDIADDAGEIVDEQENKNWSDVIDFDPDDFKRDMNEYDGGW